MPRNNGEEDNVSEKEKLRTKVKKQKNT